MPSIGGAQRRGRPSLSQPHGFYSDEHHAAWNRLFARMRACWDALAVGVFLRGQQTLRLSAARIPVVDDVNRILATRTRFTAVGVGGRVPAREFFAYLERREFPTTLAIRHRAQLDYVPEPDIFHDVVGHAPLFADAAFADILACLGAVARRAVARVADVADARTRRLQLESTQRALARFFWFTIEFGLMTEGPRGLLKAYGSGLLSSPGELGHALVSPDVERVPFDLGRVVNESFEIGRYQRRLFVVSSVDHLQDLVHQFVWWLERGRLDSVAPDPSGTR